jgi:hypothetical protein
MAEPRSLSRSMERFWLQRQKTENELYMVAESEIKTKNALIPPREVCETFVHLHPVSVYVAVDMVFAPALYLKPPAYTFQDTLIPLFISIIRSPPLKILVYHCFNSSPKEEPAQQLEYQTAEDHEPEETYSPLN